MADEDNKLVISGESKELVVAILDLAPSVAKAEKEYAVEIRSARELSKTGPADPDYDSKLDQLLRYENRTLNELNGQVKEVMSKHHIPGSPRNLYLRANNRDGHDQSYYSGPSARRRGGAFSNE